MSPEAIRTHSMGQVSVTSSSPRLIPRRALQFLQKRCLDRQGTDPSQPDFPCPLPFALTADAKVTEDGQSCKRLSAEVKGGSPAKFQPRPPLLTARLPPPASLKHTRGMPGRSRVNVVSFRGSFGPEIKPVSESEWLQNNALEGGRPLRCCET